ncbi:protein vav isoform X3 [Atheta coriaria]|uniref:protein vav isoform X3 n=1 Tax=Dalotia coriaria TaxID=877792 RepID=UPI0031F41C5C
MAAAFIGNDDLWRECASWLTRFNMLRPDHRANLETATLSDLATTLRDGVLLCNLLNKIDPGCIDVKDINQKPQLAQFLCSRNTELFLKTCRVNFGLKESELFEHQMLFHFMNFHQVLITLSALSRCPKAQQHNIEGFTAQLERSDEDDEVYQSLKSVNTAPEISEEQLECNENVHRNDEIYQGLCGMRTLSDKLALEKRDYVIKELIYTESNYVDVLRKIKHCYIEKLTYILEPRDHAKIFYRILDIYTVNKDLKCELDRLGRSKSLKLSHIIMNFKERFLIYGDFCSNLADATTCLQDLCDRNETICQAIEKADQEANQGKFKLRDLLQVPMQRILKYHLLLENLVKETDPNHEEYTELKRARETMVDVSRYINEMARDKEQMNVLQEISRNMVWDQGTQFPIERCGRLRRDGEVRVKLHGEPKQPKQRYVFIFDKYMILTKQRGQQYLYRTMLDLSEFTVDEANNRALLQQGVRWSFQWHMVKNDKQLVYSMSVKSGDIKNMLIRAIKDAIENIHPIALSMTNHQFEMHTYKMPMTCYKCSKYLKGQIYQGYKCRVCSISVHKECIGSSGRCGAPVRSLAPAPSQEALTLQSKLWFAGEKDRAQAVSLLENRKPGTYLVRIRLQKDSDVYALSLKTENGVKHMRICSSTTENKYYLSVSRFFNSLEDMVRNYQLVSLKENFERLEADAKLEYPYRQIKAEAAQTYASPTISFERGEMVVIIDKDEEGGGRWYKGISRNGIGQFPSCCVVEQEEITYDAF